jgi:divalent metal cation (Fe/Co/Zn/Cd) transporter
MDRAIDPEEEQAIKSAIAANAEGALNVHHLRSRKAGRAIFIDFDMVVRADMSVAEAHDICDRMEDAIRKVLPTAQCEIHVEPEGEKAHGVRVPMQM